MTNTNIAECQLNMQWTNFNKLIKVNIQIIIFYKI